MKRLDLIVHPVRSRILVMLSGRKLTTQQIAQMLPDVPVPTLYRQIRTLAEAGVLECTHERPVRGAVERTYTVAKDGGMIPRDEADRMTPDERVDAHANFAQVLALAYRNYVAAGGDKPPAANAAALELSDEEARRLRDDLIEVVTPYLANSAGEGRRRYLVALVLQPDLEASPEKEIT